MSFSVSFSVLLLVSLPCRKRFVARHFAVSLAVSFTVLSAVLQNVSYKGHEAAATAAAGKGGKPKSPERRQPRRCLRRWRRKRRRSGNGWIQEMVMVSGSALPEVSGGCGRFLLATAGQDTLPLGFLGCVSLGLGPVCRRAWSLCFFFVCPSGRPRPWVFFALVPSGASGSMVVFLVVVVVSLFERPWVVGRPRRNQNKKTQGLRACPPSCTKKKTESPVPRYSAQTPRRHNPKNPKGKESRPATASNNRPQPPETSGRAWFCLAYPWFLLNHPKFLHFS